MSSNVYQPSVMQIAASRDEAPDIRTLRLRFVDEAARAAFFAAYKVGQFGLYGLPGAGESTFCVASPPTRQEYIECTFRRSGRVTGALQDREVGQTVTFRGPYGTNFPLDDWRGKSLLFIAGGIALPPVRSVIWNVLDRRSDFDKVTIVYGARTAADLVYKDELTDWATRSDVQLVLTVDPGGEKVFAAPGAAAADNGGFPEGSPLVEAHETLLWKGRVGFVPNVLKEAAPSSANCIAVLCGPPIMIKFTLPVLEQLGFAHSAVFTTLENRMKCGIGKCGRCNVGSMYVCKDGPVFTAEQIARLPQSDL